MDFYAIEDQLKELSQRRKILEQKSILREATIAEFQCLKKESLARLKNNIEKNNMAARERNRKLLSEVDHSAAKQVSGSFREGEVLTDSLRKLNAAKDRYTKAVETMLPAWNSAQSVRYQEQIHQIQQEKKLADERRRRLLLDMQRDDKLRAVVDHERQQLMLKLALEQKDQLEMQAQKALRRSHDQAINAAIMEEIERTGFDLSNLIELGDNQRLNHARQTISNYLGPRGSGFPLDVSMSAAWKANELTESVRGFSPMRLDERHATHVATSSSQDGTRDAYFSSQVGASEILLPSRAPKQNIPRNHQVETSSTFSDIGARVGLPQYLPTSTTHPTHPVQMTQHAMLGGGIDSAYTGLASSPAVALSSQLQQGPVVPAVTGDSAVKAGIPMQRSPSEISASSPFGALASSEFSSPVESSLALALSVPGHEGRSGGGVALSVPGHGGRSAVGEDFGSEDPVVNSANTGRNLTAYATAMAESLNTQQRPMTDNSGAITASVAVPAAGAVNAAFSVVEATAKASPASSEGSTEFDILTPSPTPIPTGTTLRTAIAINDQSVNESTFADTTMTMRLTGNNGRSGSEGLNASTASVTAMRVAEGTDDEEEEKESVALAADMKTPNDVKQDTQKKQQKKVGSGSKASPPDSLLARSSSDGTSASLSEPKPAKQQGTTPGSDDDDDVHTSDKDGDGASVASTSSEIRVRLVGLKMPLELVPIVQRLGHRIEALDPQYIKLDLPNSTKVGTSASSSSASASGGVGNGSLPTDSIRLYSQLVVSEANAAKRDLQTQQEVLNAAAQFAADGGEALEAFNSFALQSTMLQILREMGSSIMPRDALNGMVTLERLKKEHKKAGGGRGELWLAVATHLRSLLSPQPARLESLAKSVTLALIDHASPEERTRIERKVSNLLQLAIIPKEGESSRSPSPSARSSSFTPQKSSTPSALRDRNSAGAGNGTGNSSVESQPGMRKPDPLAQRRSLLSSGSKSYGADASEMEGSFSSGTVRGVSVSTSVRPATAPTVSSGSSNNALKTGVGLTTATTTISAVDDLIGAHSTQAARPSSSPKGFSYGSLGLSTSKLSELEEDEFEEDNIIGKPPPVKNLAPPAPAAESETAARAAAAGSGRSGSPPASSSSTRKHRGDTVPTPVSRGGRNSPSPLPSQSQTQSRGYEQQQQQQRRSESPQDRRGGGGGSSSSSSSGRRPVSPHSQSRSSDTTGQRRSQSPQDNYGRAGGGSSSRRDDYDNRSRGSDSAQRRSNSPHEDYRGGQASRGSGETYDRNRGSDTQRRSESPHGRREGGVGGGSSRRSSSPPRSSSRGGGGGGGGDRMSSRSGSSSSRRRPAEDDDEFDF